MSEPLSSALGATPDAPWPDDASRDRLVGDWHVWQRRGGHRTSTDDLLTAWWAAECWEGRGTTHPPEAYLDIGCGIGSVLLTTAHRLRPLQSWGVEAQAQSAAMAARSVAELPAGAPPITVRHGDLRSIGAAAHGGFDLVTGSPPYMPVGTGVPSPDPQRFACRFETRGGVEAYCRAAATLLRPGGLFALVFQSAWHARVVEAAEAAGLRIVHRVDVRMRSDAERDFLRVYAMEPPGKPVTERTGEPVTEPTGEPVTAPPGEPVTAPTHTGAPEARDGGRVRSICVRDADGQWTPEWRILRERMALDAH